MPKQKQLGKSVCWCKKTMGTSFMTISPWNTKVLKTRKTLRLKRIIFLPLIIIIGMTASLAKLRVGIIRKILVHMGEASKANLRTFWQLAITLLLLKKENVRQKDLNQVENYVCQKKDHNLSTYVIENQKPCVSLNNFCINDLS